MLNLSAEGIVLCHEREGTVLLVWAAASATSSVMEACVA